MRLTPENLHAAAGRSVSADTIDRRLRQNAEGPYDWRHRIEQWNIQTVNEQKKKKSNEMPSNVIHHRKYQQAYL